MYDRGDQERTGIMKEEQRHYGKGSEILKTGGRTS